MFGSKPKKNSVSIGINFTSFKIDHLKNYAKVDNEFFYRMDFLEKTRVNW
jgi:hypothetical protein